MATVTIVLRPTYVSVTAILESDETSDIAQESKAELSCGGESIFCIAFIPFR
jgi:hypothetical protein